MLSSEFLRIPYRRSACYLNTALSSPQSTILNMFSNENSPSSFTGIIHLVCCASSDWISHKKTVIRKKEPHKSLSTIPIDDPSTCHLECRGRENVERIKDLVTSRLHVSYVGGMGVAFGMHTKSPHPPPVYQSSSDSFILLLRKPRRDFRLPTSDFKI